MCYTAMDSNIHRSSRSQLASSWRTQHPGGQVPGYHSTQEQAELVLVRAKAQGDTAPALHPHQHHRIAASDVLGLGQQEGECGSAG